MITDKQVLFFETFGFVMLRQFFSPAEVRVVNTEFIQRLESVYRDQPFDGKTRQGASFMGPDTPFLASLMQDERFVSMTKQLYGEDFIGGSIGGDRYVAHTHWHPDVNAVHEGGPKIAFYLDPINGESGALRVIPR